MRREPCSNLLLSSHVWQKKKNIDQSIKSQIGFADLVEQRILPQSKHHHVRPVPGSERGEEVLQRIKRDLVLADMELK